VNYVDCVGLMKAGGKVLGVQLREALSGREMEVGARVVINATGVFSDEVRRQADPSAAGLIAASRGSHLVLPRDRLGGETALMVPETSDGRVLFAIPWHDRVLLGTTDVATGDLSTNPVPDAAEIEYLLEHANRFLAQPVGRNNVLSMFAGLRPLVTRSGGGGTASLPRDHFIEVSAGGLVSIVGGKWTTFRRMAEDVVDRAAQVGGLPQKPAVTTGLRLAGPERLGGARLHDGLPITEADVERAAREQLAERVEDVLSRRTRCLLLDAKASGAIAARIARTLARLNGRDAAWEREETRAFQQLAEAALPG
jgi:glycerol-3-phosphate dehydrogenase